MVLLGRREVSERSQYRQGHPHVPVPDPILQICASDSGHRGTDLGIHIIRTDKINLIASLLSVRFSLGAFFYTVRA